MVINKYIQGEVNREMCTLTTRQAGDETQKERSLGLSVESNYTLPVNFMVT